MERVINANTGLCAIYLDTVGVRGSKPLPRTIHFLPKTLIFLVAIGFRIGQIIPAIHRQQPPNAFKSSLSAECQRCYI